MRMDRFNRWGFGFGLAGETRNQELGFLDEEMTGNFVHNAAFLLQLFLLVGFQSFFFQSVQYFPFLHGGNQILTLEVKMAFGFQDLPPLSFHFF